MSMHSDSYWSEKIRYAFHYKESIERVVRDIKLDALIAASEHVDAYVLARYGFAGDAIRDMLEKMGEEP